MRAKIKTVGFALIYAICLFVAAPQAYAENVSVIETCNVQVLFTATVPSSVEQGKSFTMTNIAVQPSKTYNFTVSSSVFDMTATNTSSTTYTQNFYATNPSPTTGHNTYVGMYPNWTLDASGPVGSYVTVKLKRTVTVVQGYGTVTCNFTKTLAMVPIVAPASQTPSPTPSTQPSSSPAPSTSSSPSGGGSTKPSNKPTPSSSPLTTASPTPSTSSSPSSPQSPTEESNNTSGSFKTVSVVPLIVQVDDDGGKPVKGAQVTLNGSKKLTTDDKGRVTFANILTGAHNIFVTYKGQELNRLVYVDGKDVSKPFVLSLKGTAKPIDPVIIAAASVTTVFFGAAATILIVNKRRSDKENEPLPIPSISLPGIIAGTVVTTPTNTMAITPAIPALAGTPVTVSPAPWDPTSVTSAQPQAPSAATAPLQPSEPQVPVAVNPIQPANIPVPPTESTYTPTTVDSQLQNQPNNSTNV